MQYTLPDGTLLVPAHNKHMTGAGVVNPNVVGINAMEAPAAPAVVPQQAVAPIISAPAETAAVPAPRVVTMQVQPVQAPAPSFLTPAAAPAVPAPAPVQTSTPAPAPVAPNPAPAATFGPGADVGTDPEKEALRKEIEGFKNKRNLEVNQLVAQAVGTPENKAVLDSWISQNMTGYEQRVLNEIMANGSIAEVQDALNTVITKYNSAANTTAPAPGAANTANVAASGYVSTPAATSVSSPLSAAEYEYIMLNDQQYKTNPTYAAQVDQRRLAGLATERNKASQVPRKF